MNTKLCLLAPMLVIGAAHADPVALKDSVPHLTTAGTASADVVPDRADLRLGIANERPDAEAAAQATAKGATDVLADLKARGVEAKDIKTGFDLSAQFDSKSDEHGRTTEQKLRGYLAYETVSVHLQDVAKAGALARELVGKGANVIEGIGFSYSHRKEKLRELNAAALRDALAEARSYTDAAGLKLGRVLQIGEDPTSEDGAADLPSRRAVPRYTATIPLEPGTQKLTQSVTVIWEIEGKAP